MVVRRLLSMLLSRNTDQLAERLADSYIMRRAAQMAVNIFMRTKSITEENKLDKLVDQDKIKLFLEKFQNNIKEEMQKAKIELEKRQQQK